MENMENVERKEDCVETNVAANESALDASEMEIAQAEENVEADELGEEMETILGDDTESVSGVNDENTVSVPEDAQSEQKDEKKKSVTRATPRSVREMQAAREELQRELRSVQQDAQFGARRAQITTIEKLRTALNSHTPVTARVTSVETNNGGAVAIAMMDGQRIMIPFAHLLPNFEFTYQSMYRGDSDLAVELREKERIQHEQQVAAKMIGAEIEVMILGIRRSGDSFFVAGSRVRALQYRASYYLRRNKDGESVVRVGDTLKATVITVGAHAMYVSVYGMDCRLPASQVTYRYVANLASLYAPSDSIMVRVQSMEFNEKGVCTAMMVSALEPEREACKYRLQKDIKVGAKLFATVTSIGRTSTESNYPYALWLEGVNLPARAKRLIALNSGNGLRGGDRVVVNVDDIDVDRGYAICSIIRRIDAHTI